MDGTPKSTKGMLLMDGGLLGFVLMVCLCGLCTVPAFLVASITFPAAGLRIASDRVVVQWRTEYRSRQTVISESGPVSRTPDFTLYLDGEAVVASSTQAPKDQVVVLENLSPGPHVLRLEARDGGRRAVHEVTFEIVDAPSPWRLEAFPYEPSSDGGQQTAVGGLRYVFDALGRALRIPGTEPADVAFADRRGLFEMWGLFTVQEKRVTLRPWIWEQLGEPQDLPLPANGQGYLVGPGFWLADRVYAWDGDAWRALPPLPEQVPEPVARYFEGYGARMFQEHASFFWVRACGEEVWVSLTWRISKPDAPEHFAYIARLHQDQWQVVPPPTPHGFFVPYCFDNQVWLVNTASDGSSLEDGQFVQWGWFLNRQSPWVFAERQGIGRTYRWQRGKWEEALAPPMVLEVYSTDGSGWMPSFYGPAFAVLHEKTYWIVVPVGWQDAWH